MYNTEAVTYPEFGAVTQPVAGCVVRPSSLREGLASSLLSSSTPELTQTHQLSVTALMALIILLYYPVTQYELVL